MRCCWGRRLSHSAVLVLLADCDPNVIPDSIFKQPTLDTTSCPGRGAAFFTLLRRAGTQDGAQCKMDPGSAAHHAARAARCAASGARISILAPPLNTRLRPATRCARAVDKSLAPWRAWGMPDARCTRGFVCML